VVFPVARNAVRALLSSSVFLTWHTLSWTNNLFVGLCNTRRFTDNRFQASSVVASPDWNPAAAFERERRRRKLKSRALARLKQEAQATGGE
jgi:hypothetical protein